MVNEKLPLYDIFVFKMYSNVACFAKIKIQTDPYDSKEIACLHFRPNCTHERCCEFLDKIISNNLCQFRTNS